MHKLFTLICLIYIYPYSIGQDIVAKTIFTDNTADSLFINADHVSFGKKGNYLFRIQRNKKTYFITNDDTIGPLKNASTIYSTNGDVSYAYDENDRLYYYNPNDIKVFGPVKGRIDKVYTNYSYDYIITAILFKDSLYYYANGLLISTQHKEKGSSPTSLQDWATFSYGERIYIDNQNGLYRVIANGKILAESKNRLSQPAINGKGDYLYVEGMRPPPGSRYDIYQFYIHTKDTAYGPVRTVWSYKLNNDGSWYYTSDDSGPEYIVINGVMYRDIDSIKNILLADKNNYFFTYKKNDKNYYNHNGIEHELEFINIDDISIDKNGNMSFYTKKDYYLYKVLNGKLASEPITNYGVRPFPIYLSPTGTSYHCFFTDDSMYLYRDNQILFKPAALSEGFDIKSLDYQFQSSRRNYPFLASKLEYFEWRDSGYIILNDKLSKGMMPFVEKGGTEIEVGEIVGGELTETYFYLIQKTGDKKYTININNNIYKDIDNVDEIIPDFTFITRNKLIFYALCKRNFVQFTIEF